MAETTPENFLSILTSNDFSYIIFFDACRFSNKEGEIKILNIEEIDTFSTSTHTSSMSLIISFINHASKAKVAVVGISITDSHYNDELSAVIKKKANELISLINDATS
ncbi:MAG TPA: hydrogenase maturation protease [Candidatus Cloacimonetes bacterium]|nr:hydrogenase maturation protease [Candidatus Cloacimonadota bacterium]HEX38097.1 hydrogenase maturation protease [Candidatus Cloacimonadota bacterium]